MKGMLNLAIFKTKAMRHAHNLLFSQTFVTDIQREEMKVTLLETTTAGNHYFISEYLPTHDCDGPGPVLWPSGGGTHHHHPQRCKTDSG